LSINIPEQNLMVITPRDWHGTFAVNAGGKYRLNDTFSLMAGYLYGWNPVPDSTFDPAIPDSNTNLFSVGGEMRFDSFKIALGYAYQLQAGRTMNNPNFPESLANGRYDSDSHLVAISLGYQF